MPPVQVDGATIPSTVEIYGRAAWGNSTAVINILSGVHQSSSKNAKKNNETIIDMIILFNG